MGKKYKKSKKVLWRRLSLNEASTKVSEDGLIEVEESVCEEEEGNTCTSPPPQPQSRTQECQPPQRKPFHPNYVPGDQRRFIHPFECGPRRGFERGVSVERFSHPRFFRGGRPFLHDPQQGPQFPGSPFQGGRRRPFKFYGRGGFFVRGQSPYGGEGGLKRRWSQEEGLSFGGQRNEDDEEGEGVDRLSQPVHTVLINDEPYTKIQTPRQEVIFKKSCWDRKCDPTEVDYDDTSPAGSSPTPHESRGDQGSVTGSSEESNMSTSVPCMDEHQQHRVNHHFHNHYDDSASVFMGDPNAPPLAGVVMQQSYPGGPMISIPVQWTPFLSPGLIPGDTALTTLDPAFTHVIDTKSLTVDPAHILPVQHDSNGCPVTVQVKVDADGVPIEIEPNAFTVSLSTLEQRQQDVLFHRSNDYSNCGQLQGSSSFQLYQQQEDTHEMKREETLLGQVNSQKGDAELSRSELGTDIHEDSTHDSQYASMSEPSTAPTTPSGELCDHCDSNSVDSNFESDINSKSPNNESILQSPKESRRVSCADSLQDSETMENEVDEPCSCCDPFGDSSNTVKHFDPSCTRKLPSSLKDNSDSSQNPEDSILGNSNDSAHFTMDSLSQCSTCDSQTSHCHNVASLSSCCQNILDSVDSCCHTLTSDSDAHATENFILSPSTSLSLLKVSDSKKKEKKAKKLRKSSIESDYDCQLSLTNLKLSEKIDSTSKYQAKREAKKIKKDKKKSSKDKGKIKVVSTKENVKSFEEIDKSYDLKENPMVAELSLVRSEEKCTNDSFDATLNLKMSKASSPESERKNLDCDESILESSLASSSQTDSSVREESSLEENLPKEDISDEKYQGSENIISLDLQNDSVDNEVIPKTVKDDQVLETNSEESPLVQQTEAEDNSESLSSGKDDNVDSGYTCKPGYIMVPILTPYYDPAVLYGYPMVLADNSLDRGYIKKKKKKFRRKYQDHQLSLPLDAELYVGETFVATPNGYMVPVDSSHMCQIHGYQYNHNMYPQAIHDDGFVSMQHSPYLPETVSESAYHKGYFYQDHTYQPSFSRLHDVERKEIEEVLEQHPKEDQTRNLPVDSADSGVSESEETIIPEKEVNSNEKSSVNKDEATSAKDGLIENHPDDPQIKAATKHKVKKENAKKKLKVPKIKTKKLIMEIEEPDFSSFSGSVLRFEVKRENSGSYAKCESQRNNKQPELNSKDVKVKNKKPRNKKRKEITIPVPESSTDSKQSKVSPCSVDKTLIGKIEEESHKNYLSSSDKLINDKTFISTATASQPKEPVTSPVILGEENENKKKRNRKKKEKNKVSNEVVMENHSTLEEHVDCKLLNNGEVIASPSSEAVLEMHSQDLSLPETSSHLILEKDNLQNVILPPYSADALPSCAVEDIPKCSVNSLEDEDHIDECLSKDMIKNPKDSDVNAEVSKVLEEIDVRASTTHSSNDLILIEESPVENITDTEGISTDICANSVFNDDCDLFEENDKGICSLEPVKEEIIIESHETEDNIAEKCICASLENSTTPLESSSLKDLGVTEAVMKWMSEVSPEKVFYLSEERRSMLLTELFLSAEDFDDEESVDEDYQKVSDSKNVVSNPLVAKSSKKVLGRCSERVASSSLKQRTSSLKRLRSLSRDTIDDYDGESFVSNLSRERLYSSSSSSSYLVGTTNEESSTLDDPRVYDPAVYSKYYQLGVDVRITPTNSTANSSRESTLAPSLSEEVESEEVFHRLSTDVVKGEMEHGTLNHIMPSLCDDLSVPHCDCSASTLPVGNGKIRDSLSSASSSGIGSSLASTPVVSPAHELIYPLYNRGELPLKPLQSYKGEEVPISSRAICSIM